MKSTKKTTHRTKAMATGWGVAQPIAPELPVPANKEIAIRAYQLYAYSGHQPGREVEFWLEAERQLQRGPNKK